MTFRTRSIHFLSTIPLFLILLFSAVSCGKRFDITEYNFNVLSVTPGWWENGGITRYPSVEVRVDGPEMQTWEITISMDNGATPYVDEIVTGQRSSIVLEGIDMSADLREVGLTIKVTHPASGEQLAYTRQYKATLEGNFEPPVTIFVSSATVVVEEEAHSLTILQGPTATMDVLENYSGTLEVVYTTEESETDPLTCTVSQTAGDSHITVSQEGIIRGEGKFIIPFTSGEPGKGSFSVVLKGKGAETVFVVSYLVKSRPYEATFVPQRFAFTELYDAHGRVNIFGFREGEKCDVVLHWKEENSGREGKVNYPGVEAQLPLDVVMWEAGEAKEGDVFVFWAEIFEEGETEPVAVTEEESVSPISFSFVWFDVNGKESGAEQRISFDSSSSSCTLELRTLSWVPEHLSKITVKDNTAGRSYTSSEPEPETEGYYRFSFKHPKRGIHDYTVIFETDEGDYTFGMEKTFVDSWTVSLYKKGSTLYGELLGPAASLKTGCSVTVPINAYAAWNYTVAETDDSGKRVDTPKQARNYIRSKAVEMSIAAGTAKGATLKFKDGSLFGVALRIVKDMGAGRPFSESGCTASRWSGSTAVTYDPGKSKTLVIFTVKADEIFYNDYNDIQIDYTKLKPVLDDNGILYE